MNSSSLALLPKWYLPILIVLCCVFSWQPLRGIDDFWAHAAIGRWMAQNGRVPDETLFLWGPGTPVSWVYHSWLSQLLFFKCLDGVSLEMGATRALGLTVLVALVILLWMWQVWARRARVTVLTPFLFAMMLWCFSPRIHPRPELFSSLFLVMLMTFLLVWTERRDITPDNSQGLPDHLVLRLVGVFLLFVVWANFHGGVATGLVFIGLTIIGEGLQDLREKRSLRPTLLLCGVLLLGVLAININPYGIAYWSSLSEVRSQKFSYISEWQHIFKEPAMSPEAIVTTGLIGLLSLSAWLNSPRKRVAHLLWLLFAIVSYVLARRQIAQMAQICLLVMAANAASLETTRFWALLRLPKTKQTAEHIEDSTAQDSEPPPRTRLLTRATLIASLVCMTISAMPQDFWPLHSTAPELPVEAAQFIKEKHPQARLLADYSTSSYLNWHLYGQPPLYIDLINAYPDQLMTDYFDITYKKPRGQKLLYDLQISHVFINETMKEGKIKPFYEYINSSPRWKPIYKDKHAVIWERKDQ
ncbi:MAG TPA: hypothetical protein VGB77_22705 [Abditibacteriaceae bacterium]|jgi:hypothetical protein